MATTTDIMIIMIRIMTTMLITILLMTVLIDLTNDNSLESLAKVTGISKEREGRDPAEAVEGKNGLWTSDRVHASVPFIYMSTS